jgi:hypothetical protein
MFIQKISSKQNKGNIILGLLAVVSVVAFLVVFITPKTDVFLGAQVGKGGSETAPGAPVLRTATAGDGQVALTWTAPASDGGAAITSYSISRNSSQGIQTITTPDSRTSYTMTSLTNGVAYTFRVSAINSVGTGTGSNTMSATPAAAEQATAPGAPTAISASAGDASIVVSWSAPVSNGGSAITGYTVSYTPSGGGEQTTTVGNVTTYTLTGLTNSAQYSVKVLAINAIGSSSYSFTASATPVSSATAPGTPSGLTITPGDGTLAVSWSDPVSNGGSAITGYTISYTPSGGSEQTTTVGGNTTSHTISDLTNGTSYVVKVRATNNIGSGEYTATSSSSPDQNTSPTVVGTPSVTPSNTSAVITWSTNKNTSTRVDFGLLTTSSSTPEYNQDARVLNHTVTISNLLPCTTYSYQVKSYDTLLQLATSTERSFTTTGCFVTAEVQDVERDSVDTTLGGTLDFSSTDVKTKLTVPQNLKAGENDVVFQVRKLEKDTVKEEIGLPEQGTTWLGTHVYDLAAYSSSSDEEVNDFDNPLTVTIVYSREDVSGIDLNTLEIHHYDDEAGWNTLSACENTYDPRTGTGEISCDTSSFSIFGLFGESSGGGSTSVYVPGFTENTVSSGGSSSNASASEDETTEVAVSTDATATTTTEDPLAVVPEELAVEEEESSPSGSKQFSQDLWFGVPHIEVMSLQQFLNSEGFTLAESGAGSPGKETGYFGPRTFRALKEFQTFYRDSINAPTSLQKATGYLDYFTRKFIETNF